MSLNLVVLRQNAGLSINNRNLLWWTKRIKHEVISFKLNHEHTHLGMLASSSTNTTLQQGKSCRAKRLVLRSWHIWSFYFYSILAVYPFSRWSVVRGIPKTYFFSFVVSESSLYTVNPLQSNPGNAILFFFFFLILHPRETLRALWLYSNFRRINNYFTVFCCLFPQQEHCREPVYFYCN